MLKRIFILIIFAVLVNTPASQALNASNIDTDAWYLVWNLDGAGCLLPGNAAVSGGFLNITSSLNASLYSCPIQQTGVGITSRYAGAYLTSRALFTYGHVTSRIKFGSAIGSHATFWLLGNLCQPWPNGGICPPYPGANSQEIDICEARADGTTTLREAINTVANGFRINDASGLSDITANFHICDLDWTPTALTWSVDNVQKFQVTTDIPSNSMYVLIGAYVGDNTPINDAILPTVTQVNYVRVCAAQVPATTSCGTTGNTFDDEFNGVAAVKPNAPTPHEVIK